MNSLPDFVSLLANLRSWWASISMRRTRKLRVRLIHKMTNTPARLSSEALVAEMVTSLLHVLV